MNQAHPEMVSHSEAGDVLKREAGTQGPLSHPSLLQGLPGVFGFNLIPKILGGGQERTELQSSV